MDDRRLSRLVERVQKGNVNAFAQIYSELFRKVYYCALKLTRNEQDANDVVQDTMIDLYKNLQKLKNPDALSAYACQIAYRRSVDLLKQSNRMQMEPNIQLAMEALSDDDDFMPEKYVDDAERRSFIIQLVEELPETQRMVVLLYYYRQNTTKQIAGILEIDEDAVRNRLSRARATLKKKLLGSSKKREVCMAASIPVLTQILQMDAEASISEATIAKIWVNVGKELGFSSGVISSTLPVATGISPVIPLAGSPLLLGGAVAISLTTAATIAVLSFGSMQLPSADTKARGESPPSSAAYVGIADSDRPLAGQGPQGTGSQTANEAPEAASPGSGTDPVDSPPQQLDGEAVIPNLDPPIPSSAPEIIVPSQSSGPVEPGGSSATGGKDNGEPAAAETADWIHLAQPVLHYSAGDAPTAAEILASAGAFALDRSGAAAPLEVLYLDMVDFTVPNEYAVSVASPSTRTQRVIVIVVE